MLQKNTCCAKAMLQKKKRCFEKGHEQECAMAGRNGPRAARVARGAHLTPRRAQARRGPSLNYGVIPLRDGSTVYKFHLVYKKFCCGESTGRIGLIFGHKTQNPTPKKSGVLKFFFRPPFFFQGGSKIENAIFALKIQFSTFSIFFYTIRQPFV